MASLAADIDFGKRRVIFVRQRIEVLLQIRAVAIGTTCVPVLRDPSPVQWIVWIKFFTDIGWIKNKTIFSHSCPRKF